MRLSILIRNYNEAVALEKTLRLLKKQIIPFPYEIIVSDNKSTDNSVEVAESLGCKVIHNKAEKFSYGQLLNFGIQHCKGEFILLLSAHVALLNYDGIQNILKPFDDLSIACVSGIGAHNINMIMNTLAPITLSKQDFTEVQDWSNKEGYLFAGPCGALRKSVWQQIPFDELLEIMEDRYWNRCVLEAGYKSVCAVPCFYQYFIVRHQNANRKRAYLECLARHRVYGKAEYPNSKHFYFRSFKTAFSNAIFGLRNLPLDLFLIIKIYLIRFNK